MPTWMIVTLVLLVLTSPGWGIVLAGYIKYKVEWHRMERACYACQDKTYPAILMPNEWRKQFCWYHGYRYDKITDLERRVLGEYPSIKV